MKLKLSLVRPKGETTDLSVVVEPTVTVGNLANVLARRDPHGTPGASEQSFTLAPWTANGAGQPLLSDLSLLEAGIRSGAGVLLENDLRSERVDGGGQGPGIATLRVVDGPDAGKEYELFEGTTYIGRGPSCDVRLTDPLVSSQHAKLHVSNVAELVDTNFIERHFGRWRIGGPRGARLRGRRLTGRYSRRRLNSQADA